MNWVGFRIKQGDVPQPWNCAACLPGLEPEGKEMGLFQSCSYIPNAIPKAVPVEPNEPG